MMRPTNGRYRACAACGLYAWHSPNQGRCNACRSRGIKIPVDRRNGRGPNRLPDGHEERIRRYAALAAQRKPLFEED